MAFFAHPQPASNVFRRPKWTALTALTAPTLPRHTGQVPPKGAEGEGRRDDFRNVSGRKKN
jgi:hypothetical protein